MTNDKHGREEESLGQFLKRTRIARGLEFEQVVEETRISTSNLKAMESDDFAALPADAFSRGFYTIYARKLLLDPEEIVARYRIERGVIPKRGGTMAHNPPGHKAAQQVSNMAEPSAVSPLSTLGYIILMLIILAGGLCWYFNINPATYLSEQLRSFQTEQTETISPAPKEENTPLPAGSPSKDQGALFRVHGNLSLALATPDFSAPQFVPILPGLV
ncbi:helix-turn-helix domain-containing protein [Desulfopila aestuarii]|uniref:Helix-turn-helix domain-containing protein n=1 Tax=Desulfopila aestuarii DSM 18488 TaxID=1121416 RepID=A0A1M7YB17_9BACT|nr:helix-turn-helix domain-containing protein [Desulfopila aestuarii]SHO49718.1 Helix-turn-helix domain-containing protein [Desulfopila aestuarii DSM 18488]